MMTGFVTAMEGRVNATEVQPLHLRPMSMLVRPGNPKHITGMKDSQGKPQTQKFLDFLASSEGAQIFKKWGWLS